MIQYSEEMKAYAAKMVTELWPTFKNDKEHIEDWCEALNLWLDGDDTKWTQLMSTEQQKGLAVAQVLTGVINLTHDPRMGLAALYTALYAMLKACEE